MTNDPVVEEVRRIRDALAARFNYDWTAIYRTSKNKKRNGKRSSGVSLYRTALALLNHRQIQPRPQFQPTRRCRKEVQRQSIKPTVRPTLTFAIRLCISGHHSYVTRSRKAPVGQGDTFD
jgi:hypothetical protein